MKVVAFVPDLMDRSKMSGLGSVAFLQAAEEITTSAPGADLLVVDLSRPGVLDALRELPRIGGPRVVGFASHLDRALLDEARDAGCAQALPRSAFFSRLSTLLTGPPPG